MASVRPVRNALLRRDHDCFQLSFRIKIYMQPSDPFVWRLISELCKLILKVFPKHIFDLFDISVVFICSVCFVCNRLCEQVCDFLIYLNFIFRMGEFIVRPPCLFLFMPVYFPCNFSVLNIVIRLIVPFSFFHQLIFPRSFKFFYHTYNSVVRKYVALCCRCHSRFHALSDFVP